MKKIISVFGSYKSSESEDNYKIAYKLGLELSANGYTVCSGGYYGIMEAVSKGAKESGGKTIGVTLDVFKDRKPNIYIDEEIKEKDLIHRLDRLITIADGYVIFPGGTGTLAELSLTWEYINKGIMKIKPILLYGDFWKKVIETLANESSYNDNILAKEFVKFVYSVEDIVYIFNKSIT